MSYRRLATMWLSLALAMSANGVFRELVMRPRIGRASADVLSALLGAAIILAITWAFFRATAAESKTHLARTSALLVAATVAFEFLFGHYVDGKAWSELLANYALWRGRLWPMLLLLIAATPFVWGRRLPHEVTHAR